MKFSEFVNKVKQMGGVDTDGYYGKQCMDLYNYYCNNVLGLQNVGASCAKEILNNPNIMNNVERIDNYPDFVPQKGDIAVGDVGGYGHVCICLGEGDKIYFKSLDQNWKPQQLTEEKHNYLDMGNLTFLRPKNQSNIIENSYFNVRVTTEVLNVRSGPSTDYPYKKYTELTKNAQEQVIANCGYPANGLVKGVECTVSEVQGNWGKIPSGWICLDYTVKI